MFAGCDRQLVAATSLIRTTACAAVVLVHVNLVMLPPMGSWWPAGFLTAPLYGLAVPLFFVVAGYFARGNPAREGPIDYRALLRRRSVRLLPPFLIWNAIILGVMAACGATHTRGEVIASLLTGTWQLYFVFALLQLLLLSPILDRLIERWGAGRVIACAAALAVAFYGAADLTLWTRGAASELFELQLSKSLIPWVVYFALGVWLRNDGTAIVRLRGSVPWLVPATFLSWALYAWELRLEEARFGHNPLQQFLFAGLPYQILGSLLVVTAFRALAGGSRGRRALAWFEAGSRDTYGIYLSHTSVLIVLAAMYTRSGLLAPGWLEAPALALVTWGLSQGLVRTVRRLPFLSRPLFGS